MQKSVQKDNSYRIEKDDDVNYMSSNTIIYILESTPSKETEKC